LIKHFFVINQFELREQLKRQTIFRQSASEKPKKPARKDLQKKGYSAKQKMLFI